MEREEGGRRRGTWAGAAGRQMGQGRVGVGVGGGGVVEGMPQLAVGRPAAAVVVLHPVPGLNKNKEMILHKY